MIAAFMKVDAVLVMCLIGGFRHIVYSCDDLSKIIKTAIHRIRRLHSYTPSCPFRQMMEGQCSEVKLWGSFLVSSI